MTSNLRPFASLSLFCWLLLAPSITNAGPLAPEARCDETDGQASTVEAQIEACTSEIESRRLQGKELAKALNTRGSLYAARGDRRSILDFTEAARLDPDSAYAYINRSGADIDKHDYAAAINDATEALKREPKNAAAFSSRAQAYAELYDADHTIADADEAIRIDPKRAAAYNARCRARWMKQDREGAMADCNDAIKFDPKFVSAYANRGMTNYMNGDLSEAIADYATAIRLEPNNLKTHFDRGFVYISSGQDKEAIEDFSRTLEDPNFSSTSYQQRGALYFIEGSFEKAFADLKQANALSPIDVATALWLDIAEMRMNERSHLAEREKQLYMQNWPAPIVRFELGKLSAARAMAEANDKNPKVKRLRICQLNFFMGEAALRKGGKADATRALKLASGDCPTGLELAAANAELKRLGEAPANARPAVPAKAP